LSSDQKKGFIEIFCRILTSDITLSESYPEDLIVKKRDCHIRLFGHACISASLMRF